MGVPSSAFMGGDVYIDFPYEEVMFRFEKKSGKVFRRFYGDAGEVEIDPASRLFAEAQSAGVQVEAGDYRMGRERRGHGGTER